MIMMILCMMPYVGYFYLGKYLLYAAKEVKYIRKLVMRFKVYGNVPISRPGA